METTPTEATAIAQQRVKRGALMLDASVEDWHDLVHLDALDMSSGHACVGAQIAIAKGWTNPDEDDPFVEFSERLLNEGYSSYLGYSLGFDRGLAAWDVPTWGELQEAWVAEIAARREGGQ